MTTRGRKQTGVEAAQKPVIDHDTVEQGVSALQVQGEQQQQAQENAMVLAARFGYDGALTVPGLEDEIRFYQRRSVEAVLETGKRLLLLKEISAHGEFMPSLERLGIGYEVSKKLMAVTLKFANPNQSSSTVLSLPNLNQGKLFELLVLDEGEIEALDHGETVRGVSLDDVDCMSVSELRRALRTAKADHALELADKDAVIQQKNGKIDELVNDKTRRERMTDAEILADLEKQLSDVSLLTLGHMAALRKRINDIRALDHTPQGLYVAAGQALQRVIVEVHSIAADYGIALELFGHAGEEGEAGADFGDANAGESDASDWIGQAK